MDISYCSTFQLLEGSAPTAIEIVQTTIFLQDRICDMADSLSALGLCGLQFRVEKQFTSKYALPFLLPTWGYMFSISKTMSTHLEEATLIVTRGDGIPGLKYNTIYRVIILAIHYFLKTFFSKKSFASLIFVARYGEPPLSG